MKQLPILSCLLANALARTSISAEDFAHQVLESKVGIKNILSGKGRPPTHLDAWYKVLNLNASEKKLWEDAVAIYKLPIETQMRFKAHFSPISSMAAIRGTMMLADQIYCDAATGKWVVAGTYSRFSSSKNPFSVPDLNFYIRLQVERPGVFPASLCALDSTASPTAPKLWAMDFELVIPEAGVPVFEAKLMVPGPTINFPVHTKQIKEPEAFQMKTSIWLRVDKTEVASCPLDFIIRPPIIPDQDEGIDSNPASRK